MKAFVFGLICVAVYAQQAPRRAPAYKGLPKEALREEDSSNNFDLLAIQKQKETLHDTRGKWSQLVGKNAREAIDHLRSERPDVKVEMIPSGSMVTADYREDRIRVFVDDQEMVTRAPRVG